MPRPDDTPETIRKGRLSAPPNYLDRGTQFRLLGLVGLLFVVCYAIGKAADPDTWQWLFAAEHETPIEERLLESEITRREIDTRVPLAAPAADLEAADVVRMLPWTPPVVALPPEVATGTQAMPPRSSLPPEPMPALSDAGPAEAPAADPAPAPAEAPPPALPPIDEPLGPGWPSTKPPGTPPATAERAFFPGVDPSLLKAVEDDAIWRNADVPAWYNLCKVLNEAKLEDLRKASTGRIGFAQLFDDSSYYRGTLVTVRGTVKRVHHRPLPPNEAGLTGYYLCWLKPAGGPSAPMQVYALELPPGFPTGMEVEAEAEFTAFYFKRLAYAAQDGLRLAPLLVAKIPKWTPPVERPPPEPPSLAWLGILAAIGGAIGITLAVAAYRWGTQPFVDAAALEEAASPPRFDHLPAVAAPDAAGPILQPGKED